jgi:anionic cell wall polymer biosynthesis LytR-Cps2A-Psr (LCP) family protein
MDGPEALAFSRNRHDVPGGDFGRSLNQGRMIVAALRELRDDMRRDPVTLFRWLAAAGKYLRTDLSLDEMLDLLLASLSIDPAKVPNRVVSGGGGFVGGQSVVRLGSSARATFRDLRRDAILGG